MPVDFLIQDACRHIGDAGNREALHAHVPGDDDFGDGGHAHQVGPNRTKVTNFSGSFIIRAEQAGINALAKTAPHFPGDVFG